MPTKDLLALKIFTGASDPKLPDRIKDMSLEKRKQWVGAWNGRFKSCEDDDGANCEGSAFAVANAAIKEVRDDGDPPELTTAEKFYGFGQQFTQEETQYNPLGATDVQGCANCGWFIPWDGGGCVIVENWPQNIVPNGWCDQWKAERTFEPEPMEVIIVEDTRESSLPTFALKGPKELMTKMAVALKGYLVGEDKDADKDYDNGSSFVIGEKDADGQYPWFAWVSNTYTDREEEYFMKEAHEEFVSYVDAGGSAPQLWYWHVPLKWGETKGLELMDNYLVAWGTIDKGFEDVAEKLAGRKDLGVSHGFRYTYGEKAGSIDWYRTYEISPLPMKNAANQWTGLDILVKEATMPKLKAEKREDLVTMFGEARVVDIENSTREKSDLAALLGIKEADFDTPAPPATVKPDGDGAPAGDPKPPTGAPTPAPAAAEPEGDLSELGKAIKAMTDVAEGFKDFKESTVKAFEDVSTRLEAIEADDDTKVRALLKPKEVAARTGYRASQAPESKTKDDDNANDPNNNLGVAILDQLTEEMGYSKEVAGSPI